MLPAHYENTPFQIYREFYHRKNENFQIKTLAGSFHISALNIDCGYLSYADNQLSLSSVFLSLNTLAYIDEKENRPRINLYNI